MNAKTVYTGYGNASNFTITKKVTKKLARTTSQTSQAKTHVT